MIPPIGRRSQGLAVAAAALVLAFLVIASTDARSTPSSALTASALVRCAEGDHLLLEREGRGVLVYDVVSGARTAELATDGRKAAALRFTPDHNVLVAWSEPGTGPRQGVELFDRELSFLRQVTAAAAPLATARDADGDEILVWANGDDASGGCDPGLVKVRLADAQRTCLAALPRASVADVSVPDADGWAVITTFLSREEAAHAWPSRVSEVLRVRLDGARVQRLWRQHAPAPATSAACGLTDGLVHALPALTPPPRGQSYVDPVFGCTVTRLSQAQAEGVGLVKHAYSSVNPFNATSTLVLVERAGGVLQVRDLLGKVVRDNLGAAGIVPTSDAFWSRTDPSLIYFHPWDGNQLRGFNIATGAVNTLHTFSSYGRISFGMGEGDLSADGDHLPLVGDGRWGFVFTISTRASTPAVDLTAYGGSLDNTDVTPLNRSTLIHIGGPSAAELFDQSMNHIGKAVDYHGHSDRGRDTDGADVLVITNSADPTPMPNCQNGVVKSRLPAGTETCLRPLDWAMAVHISCNNAGQGWCLVSTYNSGAAWPAYNNELLKVKLDGTQTLRLAHSRSSNAGYDAMPRAAVSPNGRYALFDSDMGGPVDVYLLTLPDDGPPDTTPPVISGVGVSAVSSSAATVAWTTNEPSDTQVNYGTTTAYGSSTPLNASLVTAHVQGLTGLLAGTLYHYRVRSRDGAGNLAVSGDFTFTTGPGPSPSPSPTPSPSPSPTPSPTPTPGPELDVYRAPSPVTVDGVLDEWTGATTMTFSGASTTASARLLWDANNLYVAYQVADTRLQAVQTARDAADLWLDDAVEVYIDTANAGADTMQPHDYQLLLNLRNVQGDLRGTGSGKDPSWNAAWRSAVALAGTLNNDGNTDQGYSAEVAIPWAQVGVTPAFGRVFGMDLAVDDRDAGAAPPFDYFDWAGIAPGNYAQPRLWRKIRLSPAVVHPPVANLVATRPAGAVTIDGLLGDWTGAMPVQFAGPSNTVTARVMWDAVNLYAALQVTDTRLSAVQTARDAPGLWKDDTVELYVDSVYGRAASMQPHDYQFLVNAAGVQRDLRGTGAGKDPAWNAVWRSAVVRQGTLNNHGDTDTGYVVEIAIPWTAIGVLPLSGSYVGMDLAVDDSDPGAPRAFSYFDWAGIAPGSYAQPLRWKTMLLSP